MKPKVEGTGGLVVDPFDGLSGFESRAIMGRPVPSTVLGERTGGLRLCQCRHTKGFHWARPDYYGGPCSHPTACAHCDCLEYVEGEFQGYEIIYHPETLK